MFRSYYNKSIIDKYDSDWWKIIGKAHNNSDWNRLKKIINTYMSPLEKAQQQTNPPAEQKPAEQIVNKPNKSKNQF